MIAEERVGTSIRGLLEYLVYDKQDAADEAAYRLEKPTPKDPYDRRIEIRNNEPSSAVIGRRQAPESTTNLRSLSRGGVARIGAGPALLLPADAPGVLDERSAATAAGLRRPGDLDSGAGGEESWSRIALKDKKKKREIRGEFIAGTLQGTPREMARQAAPFRAVRPDIAAPVMHYSLSLEAGDGRKTPEEWKPIVEAFLKKMGVRLDAAWVAYLHNDTNHQHCHIAFLRSFGDGEVWNREFSAKRAIQATAEIEKEFGLLTHDRTPKREKQRKTREQQAFEKQLKTQGKTMSKDHIKNAIDDFISSKNGQPYTLEELRHALAEKGVKLETVERDGAIAGVKFEFEGVWVSGSSIGDRYKAQGLQERGLLGDIAPAKPARSERPQQPAPTQRRSAQEQRHHSSAERLGEAFGSLLRMPIEAIKALIRAIIAMVNRLLGRREAMVGAPEGVLGRFDQATGKFLAPVAIAAGAPGHAETLAAIASTEGTLATVTQKVEGKRWSELIEHWHSAEGGKESYFARLRVPGGEESTISGPDVQRAMSAVSKEPGDVHSASEEEKKAPQPAEPVREEATREARQETPRLTEDRAQLRLQAIYWLRDKATYMGQRFGSNSPEQEAVFRELAVIKYGPADELKYQEWLNNNGQGRAQRGETHDDYLRRRETEFLHDRLAFEARHPGAGGDIEEVRKRLAELATQDTQQTARERTRERG